MTEDYDWSWTLMPFIPSDFAHFSDPPAYPYPRLHDDIGFSAS